MSRLCKPCPTPGPGRGVKPATFPRRTPRGGPGGALPELAPRQTIPASLSTGKVPSRIFLNDGTGKLEEHNPSGFQLAGSDIKNGDPALWCEGTHQHDTQDTTGAEADVALIAISLDLGDLDGDFDVDVLHGEKFDVPRIFRNLSVENGSPGFAWPSPGSSG